jgi:hypothetical protein
MDCDGAPIALLPRVPGTELLDLGASPDHEQVIGLAVL